MTRPSLSRHPCSNGHRRHPGAAIAPLAALSLALAATPAPPETSSGDERARIAAAVRPTTDFSRPERYESRQGGAATVFKAPNRDAFSHPSANMTFERQLDFRVGDGIFRKLWVQAPSSTGSSDGLGPLFNARSCQGCHIKDGRGRPPEAGERATSLLLRLSIPPRDAAERAALRRHRLAFVPEPVYGGQLQTFSLPGLPAEGRIGIAWREMPLALADGGSASLRAPSYGVAGLGYGPLHPATMISPRVAPPMIGAGLLEAIAEEDILAGADPHDRDGDGISGRANRVWSDRRGQAVLGRFGWKAGQGDIAQQAATALRDDIGISTALYPAAHGDCTAAQRRCRALPHGGASRDDSVEANATMFDLLVFYSRNLAVPARRDVGDPLVLEGKRLFYRANCIGCHRPKFVTRRDSAGSEQSFQLIWPYSDLLLHDMGEGLADGRPEGQASGREWRTPPLWGIGLTEAVSGHNLLLHDGRARGLLEAILWHGGEAEAAKQRVVAMTEDERKALLAFLRSL